MKAQELYDLREKTEFCSGTDLHDFFRTQVGEPSPAGKKDVPTIKCIAFIRQCFDRIVSNSPNLAAELTADLEKYVEPIIQSA